MKIMLLENRAIYAQEGVEIGNSDKKIDYGDVIALEGKYYCVADKCGEMIGVREFTPLWGKETVAKDFMCPFCGATVHEDYECGDEGKTVCNCGAILKYRKSTKISYRVSLIEKPNIVEL